MSYLVRTALCFVLEISVLVSVSWQDRDQDKDKGSKNLPWSSLEARQVLPRGITSLIKIDCLSYLSASNWNCRSKYLIMQSHGDVPNWTGPYIMLIPQFHCIEHIRYKMTIEANALRPRPRFLKLFSKSTTAW